MGRHKQHGLSTHPLYRIRGAIINRCENPKDAHYHAYGARGISICHEWRNDFMAFYNWAIGNGWEKGLQLDRYPDNNGNYEPNNCRFVTSKENCRNTRKNVHLTIDGVTKVIAEWCEIYGITKKRFNARTKREGWTVEQALNTPIFKAGRGFNRTTLTDLEVDTIRKQYKQGGIFQRELATEYGVSQSNIAMIVNNKRHKS